MSPVETSTPAKQALNIRQVIAMLSLGNFLPVIAREYIKTQHPEQFADVLCFHGIVTLLLFALSAMSVLISIGIPIESREDITHTDSALQLSLILAVVNSSMLIYVFAQFL